MRFLKLTATLFLFSFVFVSCDKELNLEPGEYAGSSDMSGSQEVPAVITGASGTIRVSYSQRSKILSYVITWINLSGNPIGAHIHGPGEPGVNIPTPLQAFGGFPASTIGSYSGTLFVDGVKVLEENLLSGKYYANIHTALNPGGQIRGQIILTRTN